MILDPTSRKWLHRREKLIEWALAAAALSSILITVGILGTLLVEAVPFFKSVSLKEFLTETMWTPLFSNPKFGILPLLCGTFLTTVVALLVAIPMGSVGALYLSEFASPGLREIVKPVLELLSGVPTVVYGYFALLFVTPLLQQVIPWLPGFNVLSAGLVMGVMIIPYVCSMSEDALKAVPNELREASQALGATSLQTALKVVYPSALSGISSAYVLGVSRAIGETMVVAIAAGNLPNLTLNPTEPASTITAFIVQVSMGDVPHGSIGYQSIYVAGLTLMLITLVFNALGFYFRSRFREKY